MAIITFADVAERYPEIAKGKDATQVDTSYILYAIAELESKLSQKFTVPFSSNNLTAKDLAIDLTYAKLYRFKDIKKAEEITKYVGSRIDDLNSGEASMITTDGVAIASIGEVVYSSTKSYHQTFGMMDITFAIVDSSMNYTEETDRGWY